MREDIKPHCFWCKTNLCTMGLISNKKENYCANCGQKLDWSENNESL